MTKAKVDLYEEVTATILEQMENGTAPWLKPWTNNGNASGAFPFNGSTGNEYQGINILLLWAASEAFGSNCWLTYKQGQALGGHVRKGEKSTKIIFYKINEKENKETGETDTFAVMRGYRVFNLNQFDDIDTDKLKGAVESKTLEPNEVLDFALATGAEINHMGNEACYNMSSDKIRLPHPEQFKTENDYSSTILHELVHWSGAEHRLNRDLGFGKERYAFEELVAEIGSAFLCAQLGIKLDGLQHPEYLKHWVKHLKDDKRAIFKASKLARTASEYLLKKASIKAKKAA